MTTKHVRVGHCSSRSYSCSSSKDVEGRKTQASVRLHDLVLHANSRGRPGSNRGNEGLDLVSRGGRATVLKHKLLARLDAQDDKPGIRTVTKHARELPDVGGHLSRRGTGQGKGTVALNT